VGSERNLAPLGLKRGCSICCLRELGFKPMERFASLRNIIHFSILFG
jgi:hypothetical protein